jgi:hypothetical protein
MKSNRKRLHEFTSHIPQKTLKKEEKYFDERNDAYGHNNQSARSENQQHPTSG